MRRNLKFPKSPERRQKVRGDYGPTVPVQLPAWLHSENGYSPHANLAGGYTVAIDRIRADFEAERAKRPDLTTEQYAAEKGSGSFALGGER